MANLVQRLNLAAQDNEDIRWVMNILMQQQMNMDHTIQVLNAVPRTHVGNIDSYELAHRLTNMHAAMRAWGFV